MAIPVEMPKMSDTMEEGVLVAWNAEEGQAVSSGDIIAQVETDKATMDLEVYDDGVLLKQVVAAGSSVPIGALIAVLGKEGEDPEPVLAKYAVAAGAGPPEPERREPPPESAGDSASTGEKVVTSAPPTTEPAKPAAPTPEPGGDGAAGAAPAPSDTEARVKASPLARRMAGERGVDLSRIAGSGPEGRIVRQRRGSRRGRRSRSRNAGSALASSPRPGRRR